MSGSLDRLAAALSDRYRIERELGQGGMATVYLAEDLKHKRKVALKVLKPELAAALGAERFLREVETTASLRHPHILPLYDSGRVAPGGDGGGDILYYVMPYVEGESLRDRLHREKQLPLDDALQVAREVADALSYAHSRGVIHRDIKPENILLESGHAVVADFGIARAISAAGSQTLTQAGMAVGTPAYMSPEQAAGEVDLDGRSDLYALGCVLFEMLAGQPPFTGPTVESVVHQHLLAVPPPVTQLRPAVPPEVVAALQRALAKTPADRFNPVAQFADVLRVRESPPLTVARPERKRGRPMRWALAVGAAATLLATALAIWLRGNPNAQPDDLASIAVLPFVDMSASRDMEYFGDGMAEEILNVLAKLPELKVAGRTSSFSFKNKAADLKSIGEALGVATVLEGSVRRSTQQIRITVQLVRARDQSHLWSETYDREFNEDIFVVQEAIARAVASALRVQLGVGTGPTIADQRGTQSLEAYNAYLLGRFQWSRRTHDAVQGSIASFSRAIEIDSGYARAYAGLADAYLVMSNFGFMKPRDAVPLARAAVDRALALDSLLPDAHASLGALLSWYERDFEGGDREFRRSIDLNPGGAFAHYWHAITLDLTNRGAEARAELDVALKLDPLALQIRNGLGNHYQWHGDLESAIREYRENIRIDQGFLNARFWLAVAYLDAGRPDRALPVLDSLNADFSANDLAIRGMAYAQLGRVAEARAAFATLEGVTAPHLVHIARGLMLIGEADAAFRLLRAALAERQYSLLWIVHTPASDPLRSDPRFMELIRDLGLQRYWP